MKSSATVLRIYWLIQSTHKEILWKIPVITGSFKFISGKIDISFWIIKSKIWIKIKMSNITKNTKLINSMKYIYLSMFNYLKKMSYWKSIKYKMEKLSVAWSLIKYFLQLKWFTEIYFSNDDFLHKFLIIYFKCLSFDSWIIRRNWTN